MNSIEAAILCKRMRLYEKSHIEKLKVSMEMGKPRMKPEKLLNLS